MSQQSLDRPLRKRVLLQTLDGAIHIVGIFDPSIHEVKHDWHVMIGDREVRALLLRMNNRIIWYVERTPTSQERANAR